MFYCCVVLVYAWVYGFLVYWVRDGWMDGWMDGLIRVIDVNGGVSWEIAGFGERDRWREKRGV